MREKISSIFICMLLFILAVFASCTYSIPENNNSKEYSTPSPFNEKKPDQKDSVITDSLLQQGDTSSPERKNNPPVADFCTLPGAEFHTGMNILFDAGSSLDPDGDYLEFSWDFGDGSQPFGPTSYNPVCHSYLIKGTYMIRLTVLDNDGGLSVKEKLIQILD